MTSSTHGSREDILWPEERREREVGGGRGGKRGAGLPTALEAHDREGEVEVFGGARARGRPERDAGTW